jgi:hypothetical protein
MGQAGFPATETKLIQYLFPLVSGRLWPRCVPAVLTVSPLLFKTLTLSQITSESRNEGQPWTLDSAMKASTERLTGAFREQQCERQKHQLSRMQQGNGSYVSDSNINEAGGTHLEERFSRHRIVKCDRSSRAGNNLPHILFERRAPLEVTAHLREDPIEGADLIGQAP